MIQRTVKTRVVGIGLSIDETVYAIVDVRGNIIAKDTFATTDFVNVNDFVTYLSEKVVEMIENNGGYDPGRDRFLWLPCCRIVWAWQWHWATMPM